VSLAAPVAKRITSVMCVWSRLIISNASESVLSLEF
jgi:hypothetical protein